MVERLPGGPRAGDKVPDVKKGDEVEPGHSAARALKSGSHIFLACWLQGRYVIDYNFIGMYVCIYNKP